MTPKQVYQGIVRRIVQKAFPLLERIGIHAERNHYYGSIPDIRKLGPEIWDKPTAMVGVNFPDAEQLELLDGFAMDFRSEYESFPRSGTGDPHEFHFNNGWFDTVDAEILYCMIRRLKPKHIIEIGSGYSTLVSAAAVRANDSETGTSCELTSIEPHPNTTLRMGFPGLHQLVEKEVQEVPLDMFEKLEPGDILFIDSSHVLRIGGDVQYEYLEILPRLQVGVHIHLNDIFLPSEYPKDWALKRHHFWTEQYLLQSFLAFNDSFNVRWASHYMHLKHPEKLEGSFSSYNPHEQRLSSLWIERTR